MSQVSRLLNRTRQSYYKALASEARRSDQRESLIRLVHPIRRLMPRLGGRKLHSLIQPGLVKKIGRDRFFQWLKANDLLVKPKRSYVRTTNSNHRFRVHSNLTVGFNLNSPNQIWVSDITYLKTLNGFCYLALITDAYSRKIVGYDVSSSFGLEGCLRALRQALKTVEEPMTLIHHSDRGFQYCSKPYTNLLKSKGVRISMAAKGNCYENALAERVNGILKDEFNLDAIFENVDKATQAVRQSVRIYNQHRPHWSLDLQTPNDRHAA